MNGTVPPSTRPDEPACCQVQLYHGACCVHLSVCYSLRFTQNGKAVVTSYFVETYRTQVLMTE